MNTLKRLSCAILAVTLVLALASAASAAIITVPTGLAVGAQYRLVYVTVSTTSASPNTIAAYNTLVNTDAGNSAALVALGTTWYVLGGCQGIGPAANSSSVGGTDVPNIPIYNLNDQIVASSYADLWDGAITNAVSYNYNGNAWAGEVWTGANSNGLADTYAGAVRQLGGTGIRKGTASLTSGGWIYGARSAPGTQLPLYAMSGVLTVVPEPLTMSLLAVSSLAVLIRRRKRA